MKKIWGIIIIVLIFIFINFSNNNQELRFRVIANSNSIQDQNLKMKVAEALQKEKINKDNLDIIKQKAEYIILINNFSYEVNVCIRNESFSTKHYNNKIIEGGTFRTIVVEIGEAKGKNYWTVLYPEYFEVSFEDVNTGDVKYEIWLFNKVKEWFNK